MKKNVWFKTSEGQLPPRESNNSKFSVNVVILDGEHVSVGYYDYSFGKWRTTLNGFTKEVTKFLIPDPDENP